MIIKALVENMSVSEQYRCEHGLSLYIETEKHKLLFDVGQKDFFIENAGKMGIDLSQVDTLVISHGHYDHGGGLAEFMRINERAKIYVHARAFEKHYSLRAEGIMADIGLDETLEENERLIFNNGYLKIDEELELISEINGNKLLSLSNRTLLMRNKTEDNFEHEQSLVITEKGKLVLIAGCAHKGIVNIENHAVALKGRTIDFVIGGFHLYNPSAKTSEAPELIKKIAEQLNTTGARYYTCHCTGNEAYSLLKKEMDEHIDYLATGSKIKI
jgi:7,8-dihydropterin-6-yl-methyl-4-(beta-D-ribofuranosyl)aminobenzene 5'-phosphate synthase